MKGLAPRRPMQEASSVKKSRLEKTDAAARNTWNDFVVKDLTVIS